jgi:peptidoglycan-associated lipoprotein
MANAPEFNLKLIFDAGVAFMGIVSGGIKWIAPPEVPKFWVFLGTVTASVSFFSTKLLFSMNGVPLSRNAWMAAAIVFGWLAVACGVIYLLTRSARTITYEGETKLAGSSSEYLERVANDSQNAGKTRDDLLRDAAGAVGDVWTTEALNRSRTILGVEYTLLIALLSLGLYLGIEAYNTPVLAVTPAPTFAEKIAKLSDIHFELNQVNLSVDAEYLLHSDAEILKDAFKKFPKASVVLEGYCDDRGTDEYNFALGYKRAEAARQILIAAEIDAEKLTVTSHGKKDSTCQADDEACRRKNRRVHITAVQN